MDEGDQRHAELPRPYGSDHGGGEGIFQSNAKLESKLEKLAQWRLDPSLIKLSDDGPDFIGAQESPEMRWMTKRNK
ncbi:hypothetical protein M407DRAFT_32909 [Tulasnella calospora MUT 4182]|uniref:Uncharacterized protein n=1 Tax=Tulasnella calospora MUT 4182 TaxID=1051891 RepID=A0A0C3Q369_9AGAM|nr:hypothetical protein M407DRAFT_32909 [Tulasnella calospora MUT 4182]